MKTTTTIMLAVVSLGISGAQAAAVLWDGGGGDSSWQTGTNWDSDTVPGSADDITISNGDAVTYTPGGDFVIDGGSLAISNGSSWAQSPADWTRLNNGTMTMNNGTFTRNAGNLVMAFNSDNTFATTLTNSSISIGGELWFGHADARTNQVVSLTLTNSSFISTGSVGIWFWDTDAVGNNFSLDLIGGGSTIQGRVGRKNIGGTNNSVTWETLWDEGVLKANGGNTGVFTDHFITSGTAGTTGYTLTSVPEPSSAALLGLGGIALLLRRRK